MPVWQLHIGMPVCKFSACPTTDMDVLLEILGSFSFMENNLHVHFKNSHSFAIRRNLVDCKRHARNTWIISNLLLQPWQWAGRGIWLHLDTYQKKLNVYSIYHLESRWRNSHVLVYHGPLLSHLLGVAPSTLTTVCSILLDSLISFLRSFHPSLDKNHGTFIGAIISIDHQGYPLTRKRSLIHCKAMVLSLRAGILEIFFDII